MLCRHVKSSFYYIYIYVHIHNVFVSVLLNSGENKSCHAAEMRDGRRDPVVGKGQAPFQSGYKNRHGTMTVFYMEFNDTTRRRNERKRNFNYKKYVQN